jgi:hypothetical protein
VYPALQLVPLGSSMGKAKAAPSLDGVTDSADSSRLPGSHVASRHPHKLEHTKLGPSRRGKQNIELPLRESTK